MRSIAFRRRVNHTEFIDLLVLYMRFIYVCSTKVGLSFLAFCSKSLCLFSSEDMLSEDSFGYLAFLDQRCTVCAFKDRQHQFSRSLFANNFWWYQNFFKDLRHLFEIKLENRNMWIKVRGHKHLKPSVRSQGNQLRKTKLWNKVRAVTQVKSSERNFIWKQAREINLKSCERSWRNQARDKKVVK